MKNCINILLPKWHFFLFIFCFISIMRGMEPEASNTLTDKLKKGYNGLPDKKIKIFDDSFACGIPSHLVTPNSILITPDQKGVLVAEPGRVTYVSFSNLFESNPHIITELPCSKLLPMIAAANMAVGTNKRGLLRVVSIGNYNNREHKRVSECIIADNEFALEGGDNSHNVFSTSYSQMKKFEKPVQAIALNSLGTILVAGFCDCVQAIDLTTGQYKYKTSRFFPHLAGMVVVDVAVKSDNQNVAAVDERGIVDVKRLSGEDDEISFLDFKPGVDTGDAHIIRKISFLENSDLLYKTRNGDVKKICAADWLENAQGIVKSHIFSQDLIYNKVEIDQNSENAIIRWTEDPALEEDIRFRIKIYRENGTSAERFILKFGNLPKSYRYITEMGQDGLCPTHILAAAMRADRVAALCSDGYLYKWQLPEKYKMPTEDDVRRINKERELPRSRSFSSPSTGERERKKEGKEKRKSSFITLLNRKESKKKSEHPSPSTSPKSKRVSPRSTSTELLNEEDEYRKAMQEDASNNISGWEKEDR